MKLNTKVQLLKFSSTLLNLLFLALGLSVAGCGLWILFDGSFISVASSSSDDLWMVAVALLCAGGVLLVVSVVGCVGAQRESRVLLLSVSVGLVLLLLAQIFITLLLLLTKDQITQNTMEAVDQLIKQYSTEEHLLLDNLQHYAECCGRKNPSDWLNNDFVQSLNQSEVLPCSCFRLNRYEPGSFCSDDLSLVSELILYANNSYSQGCQDVLSEWINGNLLTIVGMNMGLILIQVLQLVVVACLFRSFGAKSLVKSCEPHSDLDQDEDQVHDDEEQLHQDPAPELYHDGPYREYQDLDQDYS